jgi:hypothetical protein
VLDVLMVAGGDDFSVLVAVADPAGCATSSNKSSPRHRPRPASAFIASDFVYDSIINQQPGELAPATYQRIEPRVKGRRITAWVKLAPGSGAISAANRARGEQADHQSGIDQS